VRRHAHPDQAEFGRTAGGRANACASTSPSRFLRYSGHGRGAVDQHAQQRVWLPFERNRVLVHAQSVAVIVEFGAAETDSNGNPYDNTSEFSMCFGTPNLLFQNGFDGCSGSD
jgi:hypothetical protein